MVHHQGKDNRPRLAQSDRRTKCKLVPIGKKKKTEFGREYSAQQRCSQCKQHKRTAGASEPTRIPRTMWKCARHPQIYCCSEKQRGGSKCFQEHVDEAGRKADGSLIQDIQLDSGLEELAKKTVTAVFFPDQGGSSSANHEINLATLKEFSGCGSLYYNFAEGGACGWYSTIKKAQWANYTKKRQDPKQLGSLNITYGDGSVQRHFPASFDLDKYGLSGAPEAGKWALVCRNDHARSMEGVVQMHDRARCGHIDAL